MHLNTSPLDSYAELAMHVANLVLIKVISIHSNIVLIIFNGYNCPFLRQFPSLWRKLDLQEQLPTYIIGLWVGHRDLVQSSQ